MYDEIESEIPFPRRIGVRYQFDSKSFQLIAEDNEQPLHWKTDKTLYLRKSLTPEQEMTQQPICDFFQQERYCLSGNECPFLHSEYTTKRKMICRFFNDKGCRNGIACRFLHVLVLKHKPSNKTFKFEKLSLPMQVNILSFLGSESLQQAMLVSKNIRDLSAFHPVWRAHYQRDFGHLEESNWTNYLDEGMKNKKIIVSDSIKKNSLPAAVRNREVQKDITSAGLLANDYWKVIYSLSDILQMYPGLPQTKSFDGSLARYPITKNGYIFNNYTGTVSFWTIMDVRLTKNSTGGVEKREGDLIEFTWDADFINGHLQAITRRGKSEQRL